MATQITTAEFDYSHLDKDTESKLGETHNDGGEVMKPKFRQWRTVIDHFSHKTGIRNYAKAAKEFGKRLGQTRQHVGIADASIMHAEHMWQSSGRPYYKVWPRMIDAMAGTSLSFDSSYFHLPYPSICVLLPLCHSLVPHVGTAVIATWIGRASAVPDSNVMGTIRKRNEETIRSEEKRTGKTHMGEIKILYKMPEDIGETTIDVACVFKDTTMEWCLKDMQSGPLETDGPDVGDAVREHLFKTVVAVAMFGIDNHEVVLPDIPQEEVTVKRRGKRVKVLQKIRQSTPVRGWKVGSEIDLPRPIVHRNGHGEPTGRELDYGHMRSGYMRMQPCGKGNKDRKLIFLPPTVVRPDLPMRTTHGYRIQDKLLT